MEYIKNQITLGKNFISKPIDPSKAVDPLFIKLPTNSNISNNFWNFSLFCTSLQACVPATKSILISSCCSGNLSLKIRLLSLFLKPFIFDIF